MACTRGLEREVDVDQHGRGGGEPISMSRSSRARSGAGAVVMTARAGGRPAGTGHHCLGFLGSRGRAGARGQSLAPGTGIAAGRISQTAGWQVSCGPCMKFHACVTFDPVAANVGMFTNVG